MIFCDRRHSCRQSHRPGQSPEASSQTWVIQEQSPREHARTPPGSRYGEYRGHTTRIECNSAAGAPAYQVRRGRTASMNGVRYAEMSLGGLKTPCVTPDGATEEVFANKSPDGVAVARVVILWGITVDAAAELQQPQCWQPSSQSPSGVSPGHCVSQGSSSFDVSTSSAHGTLAAAVDVAETVSPKASATIITPSRCRR